jgi:hypothetical protein
MAKAPADIRSLCRAYTPSTVRIVAAIAQNTKGQEDARLRAIHMLWERGWGKAVQPVTGADGEDIKVTIRHIIEGGGK